jgi:hypothetical protein
MYMTKQLTIFSALIIVILLTNNANAMVEQTKIIRVPGEAIYSKLVYDKKHKNFKFITVNKNGNLRTPYPRPNDQKFNSNFKKVILNNLIGMENEGASKKELKRYAISMLNTLNDIEEQPTKKRKITEEPQYTNDILSLRTGRKVLSGVNIMPTEEDFLSASNSLS